MGVGAALSSKLNGQDTISVVFLGDGAVEKASSMKVRTSRLSGGCRLSSR